MDQFAIHEDAIPMGTEASKEEGALMFNNNIVLMRMAHGKRVPVHRLKGEVRKW